MADRIITIDLDDSLTFEGKRVVPLASESGDYFQWDLTLDGIPYSLIREGEDWTLLCYTGDWIDVTATEDVDTFLARHHLILAA